VCLSNALRTGDIWLSFKITHKTYIYCRLCICCILHRTVYIKLAFFVTELNLCTVSMTMTSLELDHTLKCLKSVYVEETRNSQEGSVVHLVLLAVCVYVYLYVCVQTQTQLLKL